MSESKGMEKLLEEEDYPIIRNEGDWEYFGGGSSNSEFTGP